MRGKKEDKAQRTSNTCYSQAHSNVSKVHIGIKPCGFSDLSDHQEKSIDTSEDVRKNLI